MSEPASRMSVERRLQMHSGDYVVAYEARPLDRVIRLLPLLGLSGKQHVLDVGCGSGMLLEALGGRYASYSGVDFSAEFLERATRRAERLGATNSRFHRQEIGAFCRANPGRFDLAAALDFSEHIYDDEFERVFAAVRLALRPGGVLALHTPNRSFFMERLKSRGLAPQIPTHVAVRDAAEHVELLQRCGFGRMEIEVRILPHYNVLKWVHPLSRLPGIGCAFGARLFIRCVKTA